MASLISRLNGGPKRVGKHWLQRFLQRHPEIIPKQGRTIACQRVGGITPEVIQNWYDQLLLIIERKSITLDAIWNMDEMGTAFGYCTHQTVFGSQDTNNTFVRRPQDREWCTSIECISCLGLSITPLLIFKAKHVQEQWFIPEDTPDWAYTSSSSAFTTNEIGLKWLQEIFIPQTSKTLRDNQWRLLILDGHKSHVSEEFMQFAYTQKVFCYYLVPHASHILQPLDLAVFSSLKRRFRELVAFDADIDNFEPAKKANFLKLYNLARQKAITSHNCESGFKAAGINPFDPSKALNSRFIIAKTVQRQTTPPSTFDTSNQAYDLRTTPRSHRDLHHAVKLVEKTTILPPNIRLVFTKTSKALDKQQFKIATAERELTTLRRKLDAIRSKSKRKRAVNPNKLFIDLNEIQAVSNRPSQAIPTATVAPNTPEHSSIPPVATTSLREAVQAIAASILSI